MKYINPWPWANCNTCNYSKEESKIIEYICLQCGIKNEFSGFANWNNQKIKNEIAIICKEKGWTEFDNQKMYEELIKKGIITL